VACFNAADGAVVYERTKIPDAHGFTASPWAYNGKIFCLNEDGVTFVIKAGDALELLGKNPLAQDDMGMASPAIVGDSNIGKIVMLPPLPGPLTALSLTASPEEIAAAKAEWLTQIAEWDEWLIGARTAVEASMAGGGE